MRVLPSLPYAVAVSRYNRVGKAPEAGANATLKRSTRRSRARHRVGAQIPRVSSQCTITGSATSQTRKTPQTRPANRL